MGLTEEERNRRAACRTCALQLLEMSSAYEDLVVPADCPDEWPIVATLVARQRSHMKALVELADKGMALEAEIIDRTMFEFFIRQKWLLADPELHRLLWLRDDIQRRFTIDRETREWAEANNRQVEILRPDVRERFEQVRDRIDEKVEEIVAERGLDRRPTYPGLDVQATAVGNRIDYSLGYRINSQGAAHPNVLALQNLLELLPDDAGVRVLAEPAAGNRLNVYGTGAVYLHEALFMAGELIPQLQIDGLAEIAAELADLSIMRVDEADE